jgi:hypothetical protein
LVLSVEEYFLKEKTEKKESASSKVSGAGLSRFLKKKF